MYSHIFQLDYVFVQELSSIGLKSLHEVVTSRHVFGGHLTMLHVLFQPWNLALKICLTGSVHCLSSFKFMMRVSIFALESSGGASNIYIRC